MAKTDYGNNKFYRALNVLADCILLSVFWIVASIPVITIGASSAALYYTVNKCIRNEKSYAWKEYFPAFKNNFKKATLSWLVLLVLLVFLVLDIGLTRQVLEQGSPLGGMYYFFLILLMFALAWAFYVFAYVARFEDTVRETLKKSFAYMVVNIGWSLLLAAVFVACVFICNDKQFLLFFAPGGFGLLHNWILERVFRKYKRPEDLKREDEEWRTFHF